MTSVNRHRVAVDGLRAAVLGTPGETDRSARVAAASGGHLPEPFGSYAATVREFSYRITDADIARLRSAGCSEDQIFEITVAAALGAALSRYERGMHALGGEARP